MSYRPKWSPPIFGWHYYLEWKLEGGEWICRSDHSLDLVIFGRPQLRYWSLTVPLYKMEKNLFSRARNLEDCIKHVHAQGEASFRELSRMLKDRHGIDYVMLLANK